jgi:hypothetical protein
MDRYPALLFDRVLRQTIGDRPRITLAEIVSARVPQGIRAYLQAEVQRRLREDAASTRWLGALLKRTPPGGGDTTLASLAAGFTFEADDYRTSLGHAVHFLAGYLCRPRTTLHDFIYHDRDTADAAQIRDHLEHCADYPYLTTLLLKYLDRKDLRTLSREAFGVLVEKLDVLFLQRLTPEDHARLTLPIFEYFELADEQDAGAPVRALEAFFGEKNLDRLLLPLRERSAADPDARITYPALLAMARGDDAGPAQPVQRRAPDTPDDEPLPDTAAADDPGPDSAEAPFVASRESTDTAPPAKKPGLANAALALTYAGLEKPPLMAPLETLIPPAQREVFIRKVFHRDPDYFAAVLKALDRIQTWEEAADYLRRLYDTIGLDPFTDDVVKFTDLVHSRYTGGRP